MADGVPLMRGIFVVKTTFLVYKKQFAPVSQTIESALCATFAAIANQVLIKYYNILSHNVYILAS